MGASGSTFVEGYSSSQGHKLFCRYSLKESPAVIFIAGLGDGSESWERVQERISQTQSTIAYDRAGIGRSEKASAPRVCLELVHELAELLSWLPVNPPYLLVGHSFGGLVARLFAAHYPLFVSGIVLVDAAAEFKERAYEKVLPLELIAGNREYYENPLLNSEQIDKIQSYNQIVADSWLGDIPLSIITRGLPDEGGAGWPHQDILAVEHKLQADFQRLSTASRLRVAGNSGHYIHQDEPEIVIEEIMHMINRVGD